MPTAEIIAIGTELLLGETTDTNTRFIAQTLRGLGIDLFRTQIIGDNAGRIAASVAEALNRADIIITTGGLGPTVDDPTRQAIAQACSLPLDFHPELWEQIVSRIARYGRNPTENQKRQAFIPRGAIIIENPVGTAPAFIVELKRSPLTPPTSGEGQGVRAIITLPGVPREMETLLVDAIIPYLKKKFQLNQVIKVRTLHVSGIGEGVLDEKIGDLETLSNPTVGLTAHSGIVDIRIASKAGDEAEAERMITKLEKDIRRRLGKDIFGVGGDTLEGLILEALAQRGWKLACFESGLDGALLNRLARTAHPCYLGGEPYDPIQDSMQQQAKSTAQHWHASVILGAALASSKVQQEISIFSQTPLKQEERHLTYGGHPRNAARWAVNNALDFLRRSITETV